VPVSTVSGYATTLLLALLPEVWALTWVAPPASPDVMSAKPAVERPRSPPVQPPALKPDRQ
jgi:hypothetical protein